MQVLQRASLAKQNVDPIDLTGHDQFMQHSKGFLAVVEAARPNINEIDIKQARERLAKNSNAILIDVREDNEWENGHTIEAVHLSKGILERDIESVVPEKNTEIIMYCGGGYRSVLTAEISQKMGYTNVHSLIGGFKALLDSNWKMEPKD